jgi:hypothetical protein
MIQRASRLVGLLGTVVALAPHAARAQLVGDPTQSPAVVVERLLPAQADVAALRALAASLAAAEHASARVDSAAVASADTASALDASVTTDRGGSGAPPGVAPLRAADGPPWGASGRRAPGVPPVGEPSRAGSAGPAREPAGASDARRPGVLENARAAVAGALADASRASLVGVALLLASLTLIAGTLLAPRAGARKNARGGQSRVRARSARGSGEGFVSHDAARLEARLRSRGAA